MMFVMSHSVFDCDFPVASSIMVAYDWGEQDITYQRNY